MTNAEVTEARTFAGKTATEWRAMATDCSNRSAESWERSDTDGFMSQWANDTMARRYLYCAEVAENGGTIEMVVPFTLDGAVASVTLRDGEHGPYWLLNDAGRKASTNGKAFFTESSAQKDATRRANNAKKGFAMGVIRVPAVLDRNSDIVKADPAALRNGTYEIVTTGHVEG